MDPGIFKLIVDYGISVALAGGLLWYVWYRETRINPQMLDKFAALQKDLMDTFAVSQEKDRDNCERRHMEEMVRLEKLHDLAVQNRSETAADLKEQRHLILNLANKAMLNAAVAETERQKTAAERERA